jgi:2'-5' RNA ligase
MRLFVGVPIPSPALDHARGLLRDLQEKEWPVRWVRDDALHLTLKFFGEVTSDRVEPIAELVQRATGGLRPMPMTLLGGGAFPSRQRPRVLRLEVEAGPDLELLQDRLERGGDEIGFSPEGRPFRPHLTLGRVREGHRLPPGAMDLLESAPHGPPFTADRVVLFESTLTRSGPAYGARLEMRLGS